MKVTIFNVCNNDNNDSYKSDMEMSERKGEHKFPCKLSIAVNIILKPPTTNSSGSRRNSVN